MEILFDTVTIFSAQSDSVGPFDVELYPAEYLNFSAWYYDGIRRPLYRVFESAIYLYPLPENIEFHPRQTGFRAGIKVKILRDEFPWDSHGLDSMLAGIGLTQGTSAYEFSVYSSSELTLIDLAPGTDILIISNDQPQAFYDGLAEHLIRVTDFVSAGGTVFWETCDLAWNYGSFATAGLDSFPGNIVQETSYDPVNNVSDPDLDFVSGLGETLAGGYASNKHFTDIPDSAIIYTKDTGDYPTLVGLKYGNGVIFYSGQPLEYNFDRRDEYNTGYLLPRIFSFLLGIPWEEPSLYSPGRAARFRLDNCQYKSDQPA